MKYSAQPRWVDALAVVITLAHAGWVLTTVVWPWVRTLARAAGG